MGFLSKCLGTSLKKPKVGQLECQKKNIHSRLKDVRYIKTHRFIMVLKNRRGKKRNWLKLWFKHCHLATMRHKPSTWKPKRKTWKYSKVLGDFPRGPVDMTLLCNARDTGLTPAPERSHMLPSNKARAPQLWKPVRLEAKDWQQEKPLQWKVHALQL